MTHSMMTDTATDAGRSVADYLDAAAELLSKPGAWTQGAYARIAPGGPTVGPGSPEARCWCLAGALGAVDATHRAWIAFDKYVGGIVTFNDRLGRSQGEVVQALREAAQTSRQEQQKEGDA